jgi:hypothetical protein
MTVDNLEKEAIKFLTESIPKSVKYTWLAFFIILFVTLYYVRPIIEDLPIRHGIRAIIKTGKIEKRSYKSGVLGDEKKLVNHDPMEHAVGLSSSDLQILLRGKYTNHRSKLKRITDRGPFLTNIDVPSDSKLILIAAESVDIQKGREVVAIVINDLKERFNREKLTIEGEVNKRLVILAADHIEVKKQIIKLNKAIGDVGFSPVLSQQKNELIRHETKLRYMLIDIEGQLSADKLSQFKVLSFTTTKYPVTVRKGIYYVATFAMVFLFHLIVILICALRVHSMLPPIIGDFMLEGSV